MDSNHVGEPHAELSEETIQLHKKLASDLHTKIDLDVTFPLLLEATKDGHFDEESLRGLVRDMLGFIRPTEYTQPTDAETKNTAITILTQLAQYSPANRSIIEESGILGTSLLDLLNHPNLDIQENVAKLLHFLSRSDQVSISCSGNIYKLTRSRIAKPWALNPLVSLFESSEHMGVLDHLCACFANLALLDNMNIIGKQEVIDRVGYMLRNGTDSGKEHGAFFVYNYLSRKDTVTQMIVKSGTPEAMVDLLRHGAPEKAKKPLLASLGILAETSPEIRTNAVKMGVLAPIGDILVENNPALQDLCLDLIWIYATNHDMNKMQILTAGFMEPLQAFARDFRTNSRHAQHALRALAAISDCKMFPSVFGLQKLAIFEDVLRCGDPPMVQGSVVILLNLAILDAEFREAILSMGLVGHVKDYIERLGEGKVSNPVFQDFVEEMEKKPIVDNKKKNEGGWFSSVSSYLWASGEAISAKFTHTSVPPEKWSVPEVCGWLKRNWYSQYTETFSKHLINGALLLELNDSDLQDLGVPDKFHRRSILKQIEMLKTPNR
eukprot:Phypoly_transcript_02421.p1 GENE.Phypoly_transcript_02421~~Phypoly_transcript_02421.p1  ORF type:complete len:551 (-),score=99.11 Phypoly_transcript_02421:89-1741(-)